MEPGDGRLASDSSGGAERGECGWRQQRASLGPDVVCLRDVEHDAISRAAVAAHPVRVAPGKGAKARQDMVRANVNAASPPSELPV